MPLDGAVQYVERRLQSRIDDLQRELESVTFEAWDRVYTMAKQRDAAEFVVASLREANLQLRVLLAEAQVNLRIVNDVERRVDQLEKKNKKR